MPDIKEVTIYTDGACLNSNDKEAMSHIGIGVKLETEINGKKHVIKDGYGASNIKETNNRAELLAVIFALNKLKKRCKITIVTDSKVYIADSINKNLAKWVSKGWKTTSGPVANKELWEEFITLAKRCSVGDDGNFKLPEAVYVPREKNEEMDELAKMYAQQAKEKYSLMEI